MCSTHLIIACLRNLITIALIMRAKAYLRLMISLRGDDEDLLRSNHRTLAERLVAADLSPAPERRERHRVPATRARCVLWGTTTEDAPNSTEGEYTSTLSVSVDAGLGDLGAVDRVAFSQSA